MKKTIIGVMGPGESATEADKKNAFEIGKLIAEKGWVLLTGGRSEGVMNATAEGAKFANGLVVGVLPSHDGADASDAIDIAIVTGMGSARNNINVLSSDVVIACGMGSGTASEVALALKANKNVILLSDNSSANKFFSELGKKKIHLASTAMQAIEICQALLK